MKVRITVVLDETARRAIAARTGQKRPAAYQQCRILLLGLLDADLETIVSDYTATTD